MILLLAGVAVAFVVRPWRHDRASNGITDVPPTTTTTGSTTTSSPSGFAYQPLWPFAAQQEADRWLREDAPGGNWPWRADAEATALIFTQNYLGFTEIDRVTAVNDHGDEAWVDVGHTLPNGENGTVATIHLVRYGTGPNAHWEVVGTRDDRLTVDDAPVRQHGRPGRLGGWRDHRRGREPFTSSCARAPNRPCSASSAASRPAGSPAVVRAGSRERRAARCPHAGSLDRRACRQGRAVCDHRAARGVSTVSMSSRDTPTAATDPKLLLVSMSRKFVSQVAARGIFPHVEHRGSLTVSHEADSSEADHAQPNGPWARCWWSHRALIPDETSVQIAVKPSDRTTPGVPNSMGRLVGPLRPSSGFHGAGPTRRGFGSRCERILSASASSSRARLAPRQ